MKENEKSIDVLVATMNNRSVYKLMKSLNLHQDCIIVNQVTDKTIQPITSDYDNNVKLHSYKEKGLSKSRNRAIDLSNAEICVIADDDMRYEDNYRKIIRNEYLKYKDADIITFVVKNEDGTNSKKVLKEGRLGFLTSMKVRSVQITLNKRSIESKNIKFNENFGAGTLNYMGEENIFLSECLRNGLKIYSSQKQIATLYESESSWFKGHNKQHFKVQGKVFYRISKLLCPILIIQFALRKWKIYSSEVNPFSSVWCMFIGAYEELILDIRTNFKGKVYENR